LRHTITENSPSAPAREQEGSGAPPERRTSRSED
jgi:hypothetical protein